MCNIAVFERVTQAISPELPIPLVFAEEMVPDSSLLNEDRTVALRDD